MGIFSWLKPKRNKTANSIVPLQSFVYGDDYFPYFSNNDELKLAAVNAAITTISSTMSKIPFFIINIKTKKRIPDPNIYKLLNLAPNKIMNAAIMHGMIMNWLLIDGEAYVLPIRKPRSNEIIRRIPFRKYDVTKKYDNDNYEAYYEITLPNRKKELYRADDVEHYMAFTLDGVNGIAPLDYAQHTIQSGLSQDKYNEETYQNGCRPSDYLTVATDLGYDLKDYPIGTDDKGNVVTEKKSPKEIIRYEWYKAKKAGHGTAVLDKGMTYHTVEQITPEQMQFVTSKEVTVQDIARFFRMGSCMHKLGVGKQTYSTNEQGQIDYINETILPFLRQWEQELTLKLLTEEQRAKGWQIKGNPNAELRGDTASRLNWYTGMKEMGVYSINEIRNYEDLSGIGEDGDVRTIGPNAVPLERAINGDTAADVTPNNVNDKKEKSNV